MADEDDDDDEMSEEDKELVDMLIENLSRVILQRSGNGNNALMVAVSIMVQVSHVILKYEDREKFFVMVQNMMKDGYTALDNDDMGLKH